MLINIFSYCWLGSEYSTTQVYTTHNYTQSSSTCCTRCKNDSEWYDEATKAVSQCLGYFLWRNAFLYISWTMVYASACLETILYVLLCDVTYYMHRIKRRQSIARMYLVLSVSSLVPSINYDTSKGPHAACRMYTWSIHQYKRGPYRWRNLWTAACHIIYTKAQDANSNLPLWKCLSECLTLSAGEVCNRHVVSKTSWRRMRYAFYSSHVNHVMIIFCFASVSMALQNVFFDRMYDRCGTLHLPL